jgi:hypothetical protein
VRTGVVGAGVGHHPRFCDRGDWCGYRWCLHHPQFWHRGQGRGNFLLGCSAKDLRDLNEGVLCGGTKGEWRLVAFAASEIAEHAVGGLSQIVVGVYVWKWDSVWEPVDNEDIPALGSGWDVTFVAAVVVEGWTHVPAVDTMWSHVGLLRWSGVCDGSGSWQGEGCAQEIEGLVEQGVGR